MNTPAQTLLPVPGLRAWAARNRQALLPTLEPAAALHLTFYRAGLYLAAITAGPGVPPPRRHIPYRLALLAGTLAEGVGQLTQRTAPPPVMRYGVQLLGGENRFDISRARHELGFAPPGYPGRGRAARHRLVSDHM
jgi:hypothetical protein